MVPFLSTHEALSGVSGSISLSCWLFVLVPQLIENYQMGSADGVSLWFLAVWFLGDITNLLGALWADLVPTVIALAVYFCLADAILIMQCVFYKCLIARKVPQGDGAQSEADDPSEPLIARSSSDTGLPSSRHRRSSAAYQQPNGSASAETLPSISESADSAPGLIKNAFFVLVVCAIGAVGWVIAWKTGAWKPTVIDDGNDDGSDNIAAATLGYLSAICYLGARIPQIIKNFKKKSCKGLAILFFILSLVGNLTYGGGIIFHSTSSDYLIINLPWLIGSLGTIGEDILIFVQFRMYRKKDLVIKDAVAVG